MFIGSYEIVREIGRGAMGVVYLARDGQLDRQVAIKTIQLAAGDAEQMRVRFFREARAAAGLTHPHIITIHHIGEDSGMPYIVMEYVDGMAMDKAMRPGSGWNGLALVEGLRQVAGALDYAHSRGVVHRDIKPANILISRAGHFKVADFGIAKLMDDASMTQTGGSIGTPSHMAPEQVRGEPVSARSDQFALAVTMYRVLTGRLPFEADSMAALYYQIVNDDAGDVSRLNPSLRPQVNEVMRKAMAKQPAARFASCTEFIDALRNALTAQRSAQEDMPVTVLVQEGFTDSQWVIAVIAVLALLGAGLTWWRLQPPKPAMVLNTTPMVPERPPEFRMPTIEKKQVDVPVVQRDEPATTPDPPPVEIPKVAPVKGRDGLTYAWIPPGKYTMGCSPGPYCSGDEFRHVVRISKGFWLSTTETTVGAYERYAKATGAAMPREYMDPERKPAAEAAMASVSHTDAATYCAWAGGRLPTEAEWEYAARAGTTGALYGRSENIGWTYHEAFMVYIKLHEGRYPPVAQKEPNRFGLFDTIGGVSEWVADRYQDDYYKWSPEADPPGPERGGYFVHRGGSVLTIQGELDVSHRGRGDDGYTSRQIGFRCVGGIAAP